MRGRKYISVLSACLLCAARARAVTPDSEAGPYQGIVVRNAFNLKPPTPPPSPEANKPPPLKITLTGITTILGKKIAMMTAPPEKPGTPPESFMLGEGEAQNDIEVIEINENAGVVKIKNHGVDEPLDFEHNGAKPAAAPAMPGPMTMPGVMPGSLPGVARPMPPLNGMPVRPIRMPGMPNASAATPGGFGGVSPATPNAGSPQPLTAEQQAVLIELQRDKYKEQGSPVANLLPPTQFSQQPNAGPAAGENPAAQTAPSQPAAPSQPLYRFPGRFRPQ